MAHAGRHADKLAAEWEQTKWSQKAAHAVLVRIETILAALPVAIRQAHDRTIGERLVKNEEKLLSLYQPHASVIVRGSRGGGRVWPAVVPSPRRGTTAGQTQPPPRPCPARSRWRVAGTSSITSPRF